MTTDLEQEPEIEEEPEEIAYANLIEALTGGLYPYKFDVIREYIQNSYDAIDKWGELGNDATNCRIDVTVDGTSIFIYDNATGMTRKGIGEYRKLGFSRKPENEYAGFRGIGKAAGISVAEKLIVTTSPYGLPEGYQLVIDAVGMLNKLIELRAAAENIPLKELFNDFTEIKSFKEKEEEHYTLVELHNIRKDAKELLDETNLEIYIAKIAPVPFHPSFGTSAKNYGDEIDRRLRQHVPDYHPVNLFIRNQQIFKLYRAEWDVLPQKIEDEKIIIGMNEPEYIPVRDDDGNLIAYCWYCLKKGGGQIDQQLNYKGHDIDLGGLVYKVRGITVGDKTLPRNTLWQYSSHLAYHFIGEVHICDPKIKPTSERSDFVHNIAREVLYDKGWTMIGKALSETARDESEERLAVEKISSAKADLNKLMLELEQQPLEKELVPEKSYQVLKALNEIEKRKKKIPEGDDQTKQIAEDAIKNGQKILKMLVFEQKEGKGKDKKHGGNFIDITEELKFTEDMKSLYNAIIGVLKDFFTGDPESYEKVIHNVHSALRKIFQSD